MPGRAGTDRTLDFLLIYRPLSDRKAHDDRRCHLTMHIHLDREMDMTSEHACWRVARWPEMHSDQE
jgi:hypothetical protein